MTPNVPTSEIGTATLGMSVERTLRRKTKTTRMTSDDRDEQGDLDVADRGADRARASRTTAQRRWPAGSTPGAGEDRLMRVDGVDDVRARLAEDDEQ